MFTVQARKRDCIMDYLTMQTPKHLLAFLKNLLAGKFSALICTNCGVKFRVEVITVPKK